MDVPGGEKKGKMEKIGEKSNNNIGLSDFIKCYSPKIEFPNNKNILNKCQT